MTNAQSLECACCMQLSQERVPVVRYTLYEKTSGLWMREHEPLCELCARYFRTLGLRLVASE